MSAAAHESTARAPGAGIFVRSRLGSLLAVLPLSVWTILHIFNNLSAFRGAEEWQASVTGLAYRDGTSHVGDANPGVQLITGIVVLLPLVLHGAWGIGRLFTSRPNNVRYGFYANLKYALQRLSAIGVLAFLGAHIWMAMLKPRLFSEDRLPESFANISHEMGTHFPTLAVYLLGTLGVAYHLANGLHTFAMGWGLVGSRRALKRLEVAALILFAALLVASWAVIYALWKAGQPDA